jgi:hypothetical protein
MLSTKGQTYLILKLALTTAVSFRLVTVRSWCVTVQHERVGSGLRTNETDKKGDVRTKLEPFLSKGEEQGGGAINDRARSLRTVVWMKLVRVE